MRQSSLTATCFLGLALVLALGGAPAAKAGDFTLGLRAWNASFSGDLDAESDLFPGVYASWDVTDHLWITVGYVEGEPDATFGTSPGSIEELDSDLIIGWSFPKLEVGVGYRHAEFTLSSPPSDPFTTTSTGPMVYLGGGNLFGEDRWGWGYYWGAAYMFKDMDDDDGAQEHANSEAGFLWTSRKDFSILFGYRYKRYFLAEDDASFSGPVVNLAYTWR